MFLPSKSSGTGDPGVGEGDLQRAGPLEDLGDVDDVRAGFPSRQRLGHPGRGEVDVAVGEVLLRNDVDAGLDDLDVEAVALEDSGVTAAMYPANCAWIAHWRRSEISSTVAHSPLGAVSVPPGSVVPVLAPAVVARAAASESATTPAPNSFLCFMCYLPWGSRPCVVW